MARKIAIGIEDYAELITEDYFYIDKTSFIKEWWEGRDYVTLITRPCGFGKTLCINMLEQFFSVKHADKKYLFEQFSIWKEEKYRKLQGTYPVIKLSFANVKGTSYKAVKQEINYLLVKLYRLNNFLLEEDILSKYEKLDFERVQVNMSEVESAIAIQNLCRYLSKYYKKKVIVLFDDFDMPMKMAYIHGYWKELISFIRSMFNCTFKDNHYLWSGLMIGTTNVGMELIYSDLNMNIITTTLEKYATVFGFTQDEVDYIMDEYDMDAEKDEIKNFYGGYTYGNNRQVYNPWSILSFLEKREYRVYWKVTELDCLIEKLIREGSKDIKIKVESLLKGGSINVPIDERRAYDYLDDNEMAVWSLFLFSGYLKILRYERIEMLAYFKQPIYELSFTNREVAYMFFDMIKSWFKG